MWHEAVLGGEPDWHGLFDGFEAAVDWPTAAAWRQIAAAFPDSVVLLSTRSSGDAWWLSYSRTILASMEQGQGPDNEAWHAMATDMLKSFATDPSDKDSCIAAYEAHNALVRATVPPGRLIDWSPSDGWDPICRGLGLPVPEMEFPHTNTADEFRAMSGLDAAASPS